MTGTRRFPSVEQFLVAYLGPLTGVHVTAELPHDFASPDGPLDMLPIIHVERISGADLDYKADRPIVDIDCYGADREAAETLAETVRQALRFDLPGSGVTNGVVVSRTRTIVGPRMLVHANPGVRRYAANYELIMYAAP